MAKQGENTLGRLRREKTDALRAMADERGVRWTAGYRLEGRVVNEDDVTCVWPVEGRADLTLTFAEDEDGHLWCEDELSPAQALAAAMAVG